jgi:uncharacterized protein (DUF1684 family)
VRAEARETAVAAPLMSVRHTLGQRESALPRIRRMARDIEECMTVESPLPAASRQVTEALDLLDWKHRVFGLYAQVRADHDRRAAWDRWRRVRDTLFRDHPQSPLSVDRRDAFAGLEYFPYDPDLCVVGEVVATSPRPAGLAVSTGAELGFSTIGLVHVDLQEPQTLELCWNEGYGGGLFLAFRDATSGTATYGGGRYLLNTVKGAELGFDRSRCELILDFNFAYNPSCSYDPRWACPLAPAANTLTAAVTAGERHVPSAG